MKDECSCNLCDMIKHTTWIKSTDELPPKNGKEYLGYGNGRNFIFSYRMSDYHECSKSEIAYEVGPMYWMPLPNHPEDIN